MRIIMFHIFLIVFITCFRVECLLTEAREEMTTNNELTTEVMDVADFIDVEDFADLRKDENKPITVQIFVEMQSRTILRQAMTWPDAQVPFEFAPDYDNKSRNAVLEAIEEFNNKTCVKFEPRKNETGYISIGAGQGCSAGIGMFNNRSNTVSLPELCLTKGTIIHELMHTLGFLHEQNRPDRDEFVTIIWDNILEGAQENFRKFRSDEVNTINQTYDYGSVMHYGRNDFARDRSRPTIIPKQQGVEIGQRDGFSPIDLVKINTFFNCNNITSDVPRRIQRPRTERRRNNFFGSFNYFSLLFWSIFEFWGN